MTDLERLWDDYPTGRPPVREVLAAAGAASAEGAGTAGARPARAAATRRRRLVVRPLLTAAAVTGLVGAFVTGTLVAGDDGGGGATPPGGSALPSRVAFAADLPAAESCDDLLAVYRERALPLVTAWGWGSPGHYWRDQRGRAPFPADRQANGLFELDTASRAIGKVVQGYNAAPRTGRQVNSETGTNVQEAAVDEPDTVKTDGEILTMVRDDELITFDVSGSSTELLSSIDLPGLEGAEIMLSGDSVVAIGTDDGAVRKDRAAGRRAHHGHGDYQRPAGTRVLTLSLADPAEPAIVDDVAYDASVLSVRQHGSTIRLVLSSGLPDLDFVEPRGTRGRKQALQHNRDLVEKSTIGDWLPTITVAGDEGEDGDEGQQLLDCTDVAVPSDELGLDTTSVVGFDVASPGTVDAIGVAGGVQIAYESADHLFLVASPLGTGRCFDICRGPWPVDSWGPGTTGGTSYLFDFELDGTAATHVASGEVEGAVADRWSMDEADGVLRLAVGPTQDTGNFNAVVTLERRGERLVERGRLDDLGRNEDIKAMRWFDDLAVMVTFRRVDPLYAIDLTDTAKPRLLSKLKIPGFSSYLHPLGDRRMIGVGEGPDGKGGWGAQVGLFDVVDLRNVRRMHTVSYGRSTQALAGQDPRAFTWLPQHRTMLTVVQKWTSRRVGYVSVLKLEDGRLHNRMVQVEYGADVDHVRAVPLPDGRVVVVTGEDAQFLELG